MTTGETISCINADTARYGNGEELNEVLARYLPRFYRFALRHLGNEADAEDAVQDAVLSAYRHLAQFRREAQISTWLGTIVLNCVRMQLRRKLRTTIVSLECCYEGDETHTLSERLADDRPSPEDQYRTAEMRNHLDVIISMLSAPLLRTFQLRHVVGLSIRETANTLNVPEGTVKARLARTRRILKRHIRARLDSRPRHLAVRTA